MVSSDETPAISNSGSSSKDSNHHLFLHFLDYPGMSLINFTFDGKGYGGWRRSVLIALSAKNKIAFIDGSALEPSANSPDFKPWNRCNDMVLSWLLNSLSKEISGSVIYSKTARDLWADLEARFGQTNGAELYHLQKELSDLVQGSSDIARYFTKFKRLCDELETLNADVNFGCTCSCGGKAKITKSLQDERLIHFLMGLNYTYAAVRGSIMMLTPLPSVSHAYSLLIQDEKQKEVYVNNQYPGDSSSFLAAKSQSKYSGNSSSYPTASYPNNTSKFENYDCKEKEKFVNHLRRNNFNCSHCKKIGHSIDQCYRIVGFPPDFKFTKSKRQQGGAQSHAALADGISGQSMDDGHGVGTQHLSQEQFTQLIQLLNHVKENKSTNTPISEATANSVAYAGPFTEDPSGSW